MAEEDTTKKKMIKVNIKTANASKSFEVEEDCSVKEFKSIIAPSFDSNPDNLCLIFAGKIIKDSSTLDKSKIVNGMTVHMVVKEPKPPEEEHPPPNLENQESQPSIASLFPDAAFRDLHRFMSETQNNPQLLNSMMNNPLLQSLTSNTEVLRQLFMTNPQMRSIMEQNPEISHVMNNPETFRQTIDFMRNPAMMQEFMRTQDRALSNLESLPGGFNALQRLYREIQEPMMNAATDHFNPNSPFVGASDSGVSVNNPQQGTENRQPLPNPWGGNSDPVTNSDPMADLLENINQTLNMSTAPPVTEEGNRQNINSSSEVPQNQRFAQHGMSLLSLLENSRFFEQQMQPPEVQYEAQLNQLSTMGFLDREANLRALVETFGNISAAIELILIAQQRNTNS